MSEITGRLMRGGYISKQECFDHAEEIERCMDAYGPAMRAMEEHDRLMQKCICDADVDGRIPVAGCPIHAAEDAE